MDSFREILLILQAASSPSYRARRDGWAEGDFIWTDNGNRIFKRFAGADIPWHPLVEDLLARDWSDRFVHKEET